MKMQQLARFAKGSSFQRSVAVLASGNVFALVLPIVTAPILGRIYSPGEYAALAQYMAVAAILACLATLQFQHAIIAEKSKRAARQVVWLCVVSSVAAAALAAVGVAAGWSIGLSRTAAGAWLWLLPLTLLASGVVTGGTFLANRLGNFGWMSSLPVAQTATTVVMSIWLGMRGWGSAGLLTSYFAGQVMQALIFIVYLARAGVWDRRPSMRHLGGYARRHWKFPVYTLPSEFSGQINMQIPIFALSGIGANASLGAFARARQLASLPVTTVGSAVSQVFLRNASEMYRETGSCRPLMFRTASGLMAFGILPCLLFMWLAPWLFTVYLGPDWREAGELARILAPMLLLRVAISPLTSVLFFTGNQRLDLWLMVISALIMLFATGLAWVLFASAGAIVAGFSIGYAAIYCIYFVVCLGVAGK